VFGRKSRAERLKEQAEESRLIPVGTLIAAYAGAKPVIERLLYDDDLRDNIRVFIESAKNILDELSDESPGEIVTRLWDDDRLRKNVEAAAGAVQEGSRRARGEKVRTGHRGGKLVLLLIVAGVGFLFLHPKTGPPAREFARSTYGSLTSSGE
jgi:hypothetical protein